MVTLTSVKSHVLHSCTTSCTIRKSAPLLQKPIPFHHGQGALSFARTAFFLLVFFDPHAYRFHLVHCALLPHRP